MRLVAPLILLSVISSARPADESSPASTQAFRGELAAQVATLEKRNAAAFAGGDGWLFLTSELRFLAQQRFWGDAAAKASRARKAESADPIPAIVDFHRQLRERGIELLLVPVPPKAAIYPDRLGLESAPAPAEAAPSLQEFYGVLRARGIEVLDLTALFARNRENPRGAIYCRTDSHWSGVGCALAGEAIAQHIRAKIPSLPTRQEVPTQWKDVSVTGDIASLTGQRGQSAAETIAVRQIASAAKPDTNSPILLLGDSHTLVFHDFLAERAGLLDQLTAELGFAPDLIGTRGSGATPVRISLYRRARSEPQFLAKKKIVVWCFAAREFTEADQGWVVQPIAK